MRLPTSLATGLSAAAALVVLTACGGGDAEEESAASDSSSAGGTSSGASSSSAPASSDSAADAQAFCTSAIEAGSELDTTFNAAGTDVSQIPSLLDQAVATFESVEPPSAVADDWAGLLASLNRLSDAADTIDFAGDPNAFDTFQQSLNQEEAPYTEAETGVTDYIRTECGLDPATGEPLTS